MPKRFIVPKMYRCIQDNLTKEHYLCKDKTEAINLAYLLNELHEEKEQLLSDKEHLMGCLIRFFGYDDEDIDYNLNRESNREYGKQYYDMKEEDW